MTVRHVGRLPSRPEGCFAPGDRVRLVSDPTAGPFVVAGVITEERWGDAYLTRYRLESQYTTPFKTDAANVIAAEPAGVVEPARGTDDPPPLAVPLDAVPDDVVTLAAEEYATTAGPAIEFVKDGDVFRSPCGRFVLYPPDRGGEAKWFASDTAAPFQSAERFSDYGTREAAERWCGERQRRAATVPPVDVVF